MAINKFLILTFIILIDDTIPSSGLEYLGLDNYGINRYDKFHNPKYAFDAYRLGQGYQKYKIGLDNQYGRDKILARPLHNINAAAKVKPQNRNGKIFLDAYIDNKYNHNRDKPKMNDFILEYRGKNAFDKNYKDKLIDRNNLIQYDDLSRISSKTKYHPNCHLTIDEFNKNHAVNVNVAGNTGVSHILGRSRFLGRGSFGEVREVPWNDGIKETKIAVKKIKIPYKASHIQQIKNELLFTFNSELIGVNQALACLQDTKHVYIFQNKLDKDLKNITFKRIFLKRSAKAKAAFIIKIAEALQSLHNKGIVHADVKLDNIMMNSDEDLFIIDMGMSGIEGSKCLGGSPIYNSPGKINSCKKNLLSHDIWAFAMVIVDLVGNINLLYAGRHEKCLTVQFESSCHTRIVNEVERQLKDFNPTFKATVTKMLSYSDENSPTIDTIIKEMKTAYPKEIVKLSDEKEIIKKQEVKVQEIYINTVLDGKYNYYLKNKKNLRDPNYQANGYLRQTIPSEVFGTIQKIYQEHENNGKVRKQLINEFLVQNNNAGYKNAYLKPKELEEIRRFDEERKKKELLNKQLNIEKKQSRRVHKKVEERFDRVELVDIYKQDLKAEHFSPSVFNNEAKVGKDYKLNKQGEVYKNIYPAKPSVNAQGYQPLREGQQP